MKKPPTLSELLGLNKYVLTYSQRCDCISLYNHYGETAALEEAQKFHDGNMSRLKVGDKVRRVFNPGYIGLRTTYTVEEIRNDGIAELSYYSLYGAPMKTAGTILNLERVIPENEVNISSVNPPIAHNF